MADRELPQIYLVTPPAFALAPFSERLAAVLDAHPIACMRLSMASADEDAVARAADTLREIVHARDIPLVIDSHIALVERLGLDGVHLPDGARRVRKTREALGSDAIIGAFCGASRHDGLNAGEAGADYVSFGPVGQSGLGDGTLAPQELFAWWSEVIELPVVAEGALDEDCVARLAPVTDFFAFGEEIWRQEDAVAALGRLIAAV
ncbi:thiamine-phosphate pyrophosphorylase [Rhodovulum bhavnagarense]|uniref:Thiamine-phosphate pyrophosphorylase n=1 Tax=Rhodovulum bhavnagarense TaxID=992286 RepID=A0A4R2RLC4_9RHOB|nr:thiamine phosphate synthase [Rhodovulum bhavnagarense]TCP60531.1 thiamine-phosphate pyrophosphorylase [Rhodovulum bhavnagarense]